ncbi:hypothetical protein GGI13_000134 [Coemansia sp. RSA 455]|nr:hypothetical protein GGH13_003784 [Coemansia sp. S155-1]KAJ2111047.1 hypothetical protein IW146_005648 [Coemansia sp. RSA 922]KAJ2259178.1 hypothetical protein GGI13_000134 [Coemansia sp. RSA 455]
MPTLSPFQTLPLLIVQLIVNYVVGSSRILGDGVEINSNEYRVLLRPLLCVCHDFRAIAYPRYCGFFKLELSSSSHHERTTQYPLLGLFDFGYRVHNDLGYPTHHLVKELVIELDERDIYSGNALRILSLEPYGGCAFPIARIITFLVILDEDVTALSLLTESNVLTFVQRIKQMTPLASKIRIRPHDFGRVPEISSFYFGSLVSQLFHLAIRIEYEHSSDTIVTMELQPDVIRNLVLMKYTCKSSVALVVQLARQSALTLQSIDIDSEQDIDFAGLVQDVDNRYVTYPQLIILKLWGPSHNDEPQRPAFNGAVPFPCLRSLSIGYDYPFGDDTFFRGNAASLECLEVWMDNSTVSMLHRLNVFTPSSHPKMQCVKTGDLDGVLPDTFATAAEAMRFYLSVAPGACVREIKGVLSGAETALAFSPSFGDYSCIQVLSLPFIPLTLWNVVDLIKSLPLLSDLFTKYPSIGELPSGVTLSELPAYMLSTYALIGERFRCWHLVFYRARNLYDIVMCVLLLALACPNFDYAVTDPDDRKPFMKQMEETIASNEFKQYAPRLQRLLFHGWQGRPTISR